MFHVRDACAADLGEIQSVLQLLFPLLDALDPEVASFMRRAHSSTGLFYFIYEKKLDEFVMDFSYCFCGNLPFFKKKKKKKIFFVK